MTDSEIIKALEKCVERNKSICVVCDCTNKEHCTEYLAKEALDLINRLQAENELLETENKRLYEAIYQGNITIGFKMKAERLHQMQQIEQIERAKTEAYEEFAERVHCHCQNIINQEWNKKISPVSWADAYQQFDDEVDNLLKEMVGEDNE